MMSCDRRLTSTRLKPASVKSSSAFSSPHAAPSPSPPRASETVMGVKASCAADLELIAIHCNDDAEPHDPIRRELSVRRLPLENWIDPEVSMIERTDTRLSMDGKSGLAFYNSCGVGLSRYSLLE